jgi:hypothetical protein
MSAKEKNSLGNPIAHRSITGASWFGMIKDFSRLPQGRSSGDATPWRPVISNSTPTGLASRSLELIHNLS